MIRSWSYGEVKKPETINYRTLKPERDGLFCERIFGPTKDWECHCGKYKKIRYKGKICDRCGVEVTKSEGSPRAYGSYRPCRPCLPYLVLQGHTQPYGSYARPHPRMLEKVLYFANYIVIDPGFTPLERARYSPSASTARCAKSMRTILRPASAPRLSRSCSPR